MTNNGFSYPLRLEEYPCDLCGHEIGLHHTSWLRRKIFYCHLRCEECKCRISPMMAIDMHRFYREEFWRKRKEFWREKKIDNM